MNRGYGRKKPVIGGLNDSEVEKILNSMSPIVPAQPSPVVAPPQLDDDEEQEEEGEEPSKKKINKRSRKETSLSAIETWHKTEQQARQKKDYAERVVNKEFNSRVRNDEWSKAFKELMDRLLRTFRDHLNSTRVMEDAQFEALKVRGVLLFVLFFSPESRTPFELGP
jgi:hypothetical protein